MTLGSPYSRPLFLTLYPIEFPPPVFKLRHTQLEKPWSGDLVTVAEAGHHHGGLTH